jgi:hypothetical protein
VKLFRRPVLDLDSHLAQDDLALRAAWDAARAGDWSSARDLMAATRSDSDRRAWYVWILAESTTARPWAEMAPGQVTGPVDVTGAWPDRWAAAEPDNPDAILVRARSLIMRGWEIRGSGWGSGVGQAAAEEFHRLLRLALPLTEEAARLAPEDPTPWVEQLLVATALGVGRTDFEAIWEQAIRRDRWNREAHGLRLMYLCRKWRGSHEQMFAFAREAAAAAPDGSPLHVLPVEAAAEWTLWQVRRAGALRDVLAVVKAWRNDPQINADLDSALNRWLRAQPSRHALWYHDLNYLAYGLARAKRYTDAGPVFTAIGPYMERIPWAWMPSDTPQEAFLKERRKSGVK